MRRKRSIGNEDLEILRLLSQVPRPSQEKVAAETHRRKAKIGETLREFKSISWEGAKAFCENNQSILRLRDDYTEKVKADQRGQEEAIRELQLNLRNELGAPTFITYKKDGIWVSEF
jgi:hypothetical protein